MTVSPFKFGTVGSPLSTPKKPGGSVGGISRLVELQMNAMELGWVQSVRVTPETCQNIRKIAEGQGVALSVHAPYFMNLNADDEEWPKSRKRLMDAAYFGNLAGATDIIFHPGSYLAQPPEEVLNRAIDRLGGCIDELRRVENPVILRPETMGKSAMFGSLEECLAMSLALPGVEPCLDFAHLHARPGDGSMNSYQEWTQVLNKVRDVLGNASLTRLHIHLSGIEYSAKGERNHLPIAEADLKIDELFQALIDQRCCGRILCESPELEDDAVKLKTLWETISNHKNQSGVMPA